MMRMGDPDEMAKLESEIERLRTARLTTQEAERLQLALDVAEGESQIDEAEVATLTAAIARVTAS